MRIGFIAISGLRVCDPDILAKGLSFPSLSGRARQIEALPSLGLLTLAGMTPEEVEVEYLEIRDVEEDNIPPRFDLVALSTLTATAKEAYRLAVRFREIGTTVILGGLHATLNPLEAQQHVDCLAKEQVRWFTETDVSVADNEDLIKMMRDAGCQQILIGFESPSFGTMDGVERKSNWKARRTDQYLQAVGTIQKHGVTVNGCFIFGMDGDGPESFDNVLKFVKKSGLYDVQMTYLTPFPGTPLHQRLTEEGRILCEEASEKCTLFDINFRPDSMTVRELEAGYHRLLARIYDEEFVNERYRNFRRHLRRQVRARLREAKNS